MSTHIKILNKKDIQLFDSPPKFNGEERKRFFALPVWVKDLVDAFRTPTNKLGFILQFGYFKAVNKFFIPYTFSEKDINFLTNRLGIPLDKIDFKEYTKATIFRHQEYIIESFGFHKFNNSIKAMLEKEALFLCSKQVKPRLIFISLIDFLKAEKIEVPTYNTLSEIITGTLRRFERELLSSIVEQLSSKERQLLDELLEVGKDYINGDKQNLKIKRYKLTLLKKSHQSTRPSRIKENISDLQCLQALFQEIKPVIERLGLSSETIQYYAEVVIKSQVFQISRREDRKYLLLIAFVVHQYYQLNDVLIEILMQSVQTTVNTSDKENKENFYKERKNKHQAISELSNKVNNYLNTLGKIEVIVNDQELSDYEKVDTVKLLFSGKQKLEYLALQEQLNQLDKESKKISKNGDYYDILESNSIKLQNRVSETIKNIEFDKNTSSKKLMEVIDFYKKTDGNIPANAPVEFLKPDEQEKLFNDKGKLRISLYKVLLFDKVADGIKSGALNLKYSYKYRAFDDYLISKTTWESSKNELLEKAGLCGFEDFSRLENKLKATMKMQFKATNENITTEKNKHVSVDSDGGLKVQTPKTEKEEDDNTADLFPKNRFVSLFEILSTVNKLSQFIDCFEHWQVKHNRDKPAEKIFFAGAIGYGCNVGIRKIAKISRNINQHELENTVNWYFSHENLNRANDKILEVIEQLQLPKVFKNKRDKTHTSSDGQKFDISVDSLNANYSYKYFGKDKGVSVYSFIDESHRLFYSTVINSSEREAAYVIDGLMHNEVVKSDIHSTDTHGYSEMVFGMTHLLGISFAPRIKGFRKQNLYSFDSPSAIKSLGYNVLPDKTIKTNIVKEHWDDIVRMAATIKLKETSASQLFKRLSSYSKQHSLYKALKEFGRIIKTLFLLKYIDNVELRQTIEKQLNKLESSNKFAKAVFYGNNQEFQQATKEEQLIAEGCKRLIENSIILWNYLYLSKLLYETSSEAEKYNLIEVIKSGSVVAWQHINLQGEYDFSEETLKDSIEFKLPELLELEIV